MEAASGSDLFSFQTSVVSVFGTWLTSGLGECPLCAPEANNPWRSAFDHTGHAANPTSAVVSAGSGIPQSRTRNAASKTRPLRPSFRGDAKHRTTVCNCTSENLEIPGLVLRTIPEW